MSVEDAPALERTSQGAEKLRADDCVVDDGPLDEWTRWPPHHPNPPGLVKVFSVERHVGQQRRRLRHGELLQPVEHFSIEPRVVAVWRTNRVHAKCEQMISGKAELDVREMKEAAGQQAGANQQHQR